MAFPRFRSALRSLVGADVRDENKKLRGQVQRAKVYFNKLVQAARTGNGSYVGVRSERDEDAANKQSMEDLAAVLQRSQELDINNPDIRGFHRTRTAQIVGSHVRFKASANADEVGVAPDKLLGICGQIDRLRHLHSRSGGFDSTGKGRTEGIQQVRSVLTALIHGRCLIHRVWRTENRILPFSIELIPGVRISTPIDKQGDPKISFGVEYSDEHRSRVVAYHVRRPAKTIGDSFVPDYTWDRLPVEDCSLMELIEPAGMDAALPVAVAITRIARNRGEFIESVAEGARAQASIFATTEVAKGDDPFQRAVDDEMEDYAGFVDMGPVKMLYSAPGETVKPFTVTLPDPDFVGFNDVADERSSRGVHCSKSRFTRRVNSSWAGGRMEDQQDDPIIDQYREVMVAAWRKVNGWFIESIWLESAIDLPGYSVKTKVFWEEFRAQFPGKLHINPQDTMGAREAGLKLRSLTPQQACEEDGKDFRENLKQWAEAKKHIADAEAEAGLEPGSLDILFTGAQMSSSSGQTITDLDAEAAAKDGDGKASDSIPIRSSKSRRA